MRNKGTFSRLRLSVAKKYLAILSRKWMSYIGSLLALLILAYTFFNITFQKNSFLSKGPLSSSHANFEGDCASCHTKFASVTNEKCSVCHEKYGDKLGVYTFNAHYLYRSDDFRRLVISENENPCFSCHPDHLGREAIITQAPDSRCLLCHDFGSFNDKHPQFEFIAKQIPDNSNLKFSHIKHVQRVLKREKLGDIEKSCLYCHNPKPDGKSFEAINFNRHCDACHLTSAAATPWLKIESGNNSRSPGVKTLQAMRKQPAPGAVSAFYLNPNEFQKRGNKVKKSPIYHEDPWIMENLKLLRHWIYPNPGLVDLLKTSGDVSSNNVGILYREAVQTLRQYALGLRSRPEKFVQRDLVRIDQYLQVVEKRLRDPYTPLDDTKFLLGTAVKNSSLTQDETTEFENFVNLLTEPCQVCHLVANATILRVQKDQRILKRAEFNHRDHILQRRCLDCHSRISFPESAGPAAAAVQSIDHARIQNIPGIETCQECHQAKVTSNRCITCHNFHPNKSQRSNLLLYLH